MPPIADLLRLAVQAHRNGQLEEAQKAYDEILRQEPLNADTLNLSGLLCWQTGQHARAVDLLRRAISIDAARPQFHANLGEAYRGLGQLPQAIEAYTQAMKLAPNEFEVHNNLGTLYQRTGQFNDAEACYRRALLIRPENVDARFNLGTALQLQGKLHAAAVCYEEVLKLDANHARALVNLGGISAMEQNLARAAHCFERAAELDPRTPGIHYNLGNVMSNLRQFEKAIPCYLRALELNPQYVDALCNLGSALQEVRRYDEAIAYLERARQIKPDFAIAHCNLGVALQDLGRLDEARMCFERAAELDPYKPEFSFNLATILKDQGDIAGAIARFDRVLKVQPANPKALCSRGTTYLSIGDYRQGFAGYEHRVGLPQFDTHTYPQPRWDGSPLGESTLLVHCEQGLGDTLQFIRYIHRIVDRGKNIIIASHPELIPLLQQSGYQSLVSRDEPLPPFDVHIPLLSLPFVLGTEVSTVPRDIPYLAADRMQVDRWRRELAGFSGLKVGIVWQGRANFRGDRMRSMRLSTLAPLASVPGVQIFSLQKGVGSEQLDALAASLGIVDLGRKVDMSGGAFLDSAAIIRNLDLVISTDTGIAHLAGALGARCWVALSTVPDWRWMLAGETTPWYPTMRLFRQSVLGQWGDVIERMVAELTSLTQDS